MLSHVETTTYGLQSIKYRTAKDWNNIQQKLNNFDFQKEYLPTFINSLKKHFRNLLMSLLLVNLFLPSFWQITEIQLTDKTIFGV